MRCIPKLSGKIIDSQSKARLILLALLVAIAGSTRAAEVSIDEATLRLQGEIKQGDFESIVDVLKSSEQFPNYLTVNSPGGDVHEATRIGTLLRSLGMGVRVNGTCNSACFFILAAGVFRVALDYDIGIHRPFYNQEYFAGLSLVEAEQKYRELEQRSRNYLRAMGVPTEVVEMMFSVPSDDIHNLSKNERAFLSEQSYAYEEWIKAKCTPLTPNERRDFNVFDQFDKHPEKHYPSVGYYEYLQTKYDAFDDCVKRLNEDTRSSVLKQYE